MIVVVNRLTVPAGFGAKLEQMFQGSDRMKGVPGFVDFALLKEGPTDDGQQERYATLTRWTDRAALDAWTQSEGFRQAHRHAGQGGPIESQVSIYEAVVEVA